MKQLLQNLANGKTSVVDVPAPLATPRHILVQVAASAISAGTERSVIDFAGKSLIEKARSRPDLVKQVVDKAKREGWLTAIEAARSRLDEDVALGYSNAGTVIAMGHGSGGFRIGDRVACAGGGFATHSQVVSVPENLVALIPSGKGLREVEFEEAALGAVAAIALHGARLAELQIGELVAVIGLGLVGQMAVQFARANGCIVIGMDPSRSRCALAEQMGCTEAATTAEGLKWAAARYSVGHGADAVLIAAATASDEPVSLAAEIARDRARVVAIGAVGMDLPRKPYYVKELDFRVSRSYGPGRYDSEYEEKGRDYPIGYVRWTEGRNLASVMQLLAAGRVDFRPLITHRFPIEQSQEAYALITEKASAECLGVILTYPQEERPARRIGLPRMKAQASRMSESTPDSICLGMIGAGNFAKSTLLPAIKTVGGARLGGLCTAGGTRARTIGERAGFIYCTSDPAELLNDPAINSIAICTRHASHARLVCQALEAGKHVFCEKPLALSEHELSSIVEAYARTDSNLLLQVGYNRRFAPLSRRLKAFLADVTEPMVFHYRVNSGFIPRDHWTQDREEGGGRILGEVCHFVDFLRFLCGHPVVAVTGTLMENAGRYADDNLAATFRFADGSIGTITYCANGDRSFSKERVEVFAQGRVAVLEDFRCLRTVKDGKTRTTRLWGRSDKGHRDEWRAFRNAIRTGGPAPIPIEEILNTSLATFALLRSLAEPSWINVDTGISLGRDKNETQIANTSSEDADEAVLV
jgi:predicted dehydrogenase/threonine dehydrogenase-like Zn-dependent dehydrogenase